MGSEGFRNAEKQWLAVAHSVLEQATAAVARLCKDEDPRTDLTSGGDEWFQGVEPEVRIESDCVNSAGTRRPKVGSGVRRSCRVYVPSLRIQDDE